MYSTGPPSEDKLFTEQEGQALRWDEHSEPPLGVQPHVRFPTSTDHHSDPGQDEGIQGDLDSHPILIQGSMVTRTLTYVSSGSRSTPTLTSEYGERPEHCQADSISPICGTPPETKGLITPWQSSSVDPGEIQRRASTPAHGGHG